MLAQNTSGFKGVFWFPSGNKWHAKIVVDSREISLGYYLDKVDAARAYNDGSIRYHGEFGQINVLPCPASEAPHS